MAKRQAAHMLLQILQDNQGDAQGIAYDEDDEEVGPKAVPGVMPPGVNRFANLKDTKVSIHSLHSPKMLQSLKSLATAKGEKITNLKTTSLNTEGLDFVSFLLEIALEQKFDVTFVDLDEKSRHGKVQCLVQLSLQPVAVCFASGDTKLDAHNAAAQNALEYLKVMCK